MRARKILDDPHSAAWWLEATTKYMAECKIRREKLEASAFATSMNPFEAELRYRALVHEEQAEILILYAKHRPDGPREGECVPNAVEWALGKRSAPK